MTRLSLIRATLTASTAAALLAGCTVGPDFQHPAAPGQAGYLAPGDTSAARSAPHGGPVAVAGTGPALRWWRAFGSPQLDALVDQAIAHNASLDASNATLAAAREQLAAARGTQLPQVDANARVEHERVNLSAYGFPGQNPEFDLYSVGGGISYDLDLFGGRRRQVEQVGARAEAQLRQTEAAHLTVAGQVVNQVLLVATIRARIATAEALLAEDQRNVDLTEARRRAGEGTLVEVLNARSQLEADRGDIPQLGQQLGEARHLLATLVGIAPADLGPTDFDMTSLTLPAQIPVSLPSALVHKRPDILQAEADLHAATAAIGVATAHLYPDITLGATLEQGAPGIGSVFSNAFRGFDVFGGVSAPIFHGGTLKAERRAAEADARISLARYQQTVLRAFVQVSDVLSALGTDQAAIESLQRANAAADVGARDAQTAYRLGGGNLLQVVDAQRTVSRARQALVQAQGQRYQDLVQLYTATAADWRMAGS
jgi:NodT family efflux transporter outer membrane factor (OMF) lipoprotein